MRDPEGLYELTGALPALDRPVLLHAMTGFIDAGQAAGLATSAVLQALPHEVIARFDADEVVDYRSRRPTMTFERDHWAHYEDPALVLRAVEDPSGQTFLLLTGPEPDLQWERFAAAVLGLVERLGVRLTVGMHGIPMAVPHTRPLGVITHATRPDLVADQKSWIDTVQVPGSAAGLLEWRLGQHGHDAVGFVAQVPHYLADSDYPQAAELLLDSAREVTGLALPASTLADAAESTREQLNEQVAGSPEVAQVVHALEEQYDAFVRAAGRSLLATHEGGLPTADQLGAEVEKFLAQRPDEN